MAYALLHKDPTAHRPLEGLALTDADIDNVRENPRDTYRIVEITEEQYNQLLNEEKVILEYDGTTLNLVDEPEGNTNFTEETMAVHIQAQKEFAQDSLKCEWKTEAHKAKLNAHIAALDALDVSTLIPCTEGFYKKVQELGHTDIMHNYLM